MMGDMGRSFDGSYAEMTRVPAASVFAVDTDLDWATLGALPEMFQTSQGSLSAGLQAKRGETLLRISNAPGWVSSWSGSWHLREIESSRRLEPASWRPEWA